MKKILFTLLFFSTATLNVFAATCYNKWVKDLNGVIREYQRDINHCNNTLYGRARCITEADLSFAQNIDAAGDAYYLCLGYP